MNVIAFVLQGVGILLGVPAFLFIVATGDVRLAKLKPGFEQKLIDAFKLILIASIVGDLLFLTGLAIKENWIMFAFFLLMDIGSTLMLIGQGRHAQWGLDLRRADGAGMFWCRNCVEVHHIDGGCYVIKTKEGA